VKTTPVPQSANYFWPYLCILKYPEKFPVTNVPAYFDPTPATEKKSFITLTPAPASSFRKSTQTGKN